VEQHLQSCAECRADLQSLRQTVSLLRAVPSLKSPRSFLLPASEGVMQRQAHRRRLAYGSLRLATSFATVLLILAVSGDAVLRLQVLPGSVAAPAVKVAAHATEVLEAAPMMAVESSDSSRAEDALSGTQPLVGAAPDTATPQVVLEADVADTPAPEAAAHEKTTSPATLPSLTFARPAAPPEPPTPAELSVAEEITPTWAATPAAQPTPGVTEAQAALVPTEEQAALAPTEAPLPTRTAVPPTAAPSLPPPAVEAHAPKVEPRFGLNALLEAVQPTLPRIEVILASTVGVLLVAMLWLRSKLGV
jgi:hypothetical protein